MLIGHHTTNFKNTILKKKKIKQPKKSIPSEGNGPWGKPREKPTLFPLRTLILPA